MKAAKPPILLIGIGNELRSDDAAGLLVVRRLKKLNLAGVEIVEFSGDAAQLLDAWASHDVVYLFDATASVTRAGTIRRFEPHRQAIPAHLFNLSTHSFGLAEAIELGRTLKRLPQALIVYGIEGGSFGAGQPVSDSVTASAQAVSETALAELQKRLSDDA